MNMIGTSQKPRRLASLAYTAVVVNLVLAVVLSGVGGLALAAPLAATPIALGAAESYSVLAGTTVTNVPSVGTSMPGNLGVSPGTAITGFPPGVVGPPGTIQPTNPTPAAAQLANTKAFGDLDQTCTTTYSGVQDLSLVPPLGPGVYCADAFILTRSLTLIGSGVWIFKAAQTLTTSPNSTVTGGDPCNVWWRLGSSGILDTGTQFIGNILALTSISLRTGASLNGRALAQTGAVTLDANPITGPICASAATATATATATPTRTATATPTRTATATPTRTATATPTRTATATSTRTATATATRTTTATSTRTATATATRTATATGISPSTATGTSSPTATGTGTQRPTGTGTQRPTGTGTQRPTGTGTQRPTATATKRPAATHLPTTTAPGLPGTGFGMGVRTILSKQPAEKSYANLGDLWLEIPRLGVQLPIVGVPQTADGWDVTWLADQAGWLNGTAFPTWEGNSVLTGHVYDANGNPGPFVRLNQMWYGDKVIVHAWGDQYVYEVREVSQVSPKDTGAMLKHQVLPWLTLVTCRGYDVASDSYMYRVLVRAVLVEIK